MNIKLKQILLVVFLGLSICVASSQRLTQIWIAVTQIPRVALTNSSVSLVQYDTLLDFHAETPGAQFSFNPSNSAYGNATTWTMSDSIPRNSTIFSNSIGPDIQFGFTAQTADGHTRSSTGTHWLRGDFSNTNGSEYIDYRIAGTNSCQADFWLCLSNPVNGDVANSRDLFLWYDNPYFVMQAFFNEGNTQPFVGIHTSAVGTINGGQRFPRNTYVHSQMVYDAPNNIMFVTHRDAMTGTFLYSSILYATNITSEVQGLFRKAEGYIALPGMTGDEYSTAYLLKFGNIDTNRPPWVPVPQSSVSAFQLGDGIAKVTWQDNNFNLLTNIVEVSNVTWTAAQQMMPNTNAATFSGLTVGETYFFRTRPYFHSTNNTVANAVSGPVTITNVGVLPIAEYKFNGDTTDSSGYGHDGTPLNSPTYTTGADSIVNHAILLDGTSQAVATSIQPLGAGDVSLVCWVKPTILLGSVRTVVSELYCILEFSPIATDSYLSFSSDTGTSGAFSIYGGQTNEWVQLAFTRPASGSGSVVYTNGVVFWSGNSGTPTQLYNLYIGQNTSIGGNCFAGAIDDVKIYNVLLTQVQIQALTPQ